MRGEIFSSIRVLKWITVRNVHTSGLLLINAVIAALVLAGQESLEFAVVLCCNIAGQLV